MSVVLLPGLDGTGRLFSPLIAAISDDVQTQVISYDSNNPKGLAEHGDEVLRVVDRWESTVVIAESFSSLVLVQLLSRGIRPKATIVCAGFTAPPRPFLLNLAGWLPLTAIMRIPPSRYALRAACLGWDVPESVVDTAMKAISSVQPEVLATRLRIVAQTKLESVAGLDVPMLYLRPSGDRLVPSRAVDGFREVSSKFRIQEVEGPHFLLQARPVESWRAVKGYLDTLPD